MLVLFCNNCPSKDFWIFLYSWFMEKMKRAIFGNLRDITKNDMTENNIAYGKASMSEAAIIDNRFYSTVTKDIPTILTGILQESASIFKILSNTTNIPIGNSCFPKSKIS